MSAQTGSMPPSGPASSRLADRARFRFGRLASEPNPIWIRELKQSARLGRTPVILAVLTILMTLLMAAIGGVMATTSSPAQTGAVLFQTYFSVAYFVVSLVGPAVAANAIASEREGRTWEAILLTGLRPGPVARGKFLAAYTSIALYIVMLAPVGAVPFLFGGVTATEVVVAFVFLFLFALLGVAFGLALSSKLASLRAAIVITLLLAFPLSIAAYSAFGVGLSVVMHKLWPAIPDGPPVWLPTAYARAPFGLEYLAYLVALPLAAIAIPAWFLYEVTIANLCTATDDRSTGLKRWFLVTTPVLVVVAAIPVAVTVGSDRFVAAMFGASALAAYLGLCAFLFQGEPIGASRRVRAQWDRLRASRFRRFLGPSLPNATLLQLVLGCAGMVALGVFLAILLDDKSAMGSTRALQATTFTAYAVGFYLFVVGAAAYARARASTPLVARIVLLGVLFGAAAVPWVAAAVDGMLADSGTRYEALAVASPSPFYAFVMLAELDKYDPSSTILAPGAVCIAIWALAGVLLALAARRRCAGIVARHEAMLAEAQRRLDEEDAAAIATPAEPPPETTDAAPAPG